MKIIIDEKVCLKHKLSLEEFLFALAIRSSENPAGELLNMENREILIKDRDVYMVTQHWSDVLDEILYDSTNSRSNEELMELATKIQECFPKMAQPDKWGRPTRYYFRCNKREIMLSLKRFYEAYGEVLEDLTDDDIIDATKRYVASFNGNYSGMRLAKYFIFKNDKKTDVDGTIYVDQISDLMTYLDNKEEAKEGVVINNSDDWMMNVKN